MNSIASLSPAQLRHAAEIKEKIVALEKQLQQITGGSGPAPANVDGRRRKRGPMSPAAKAKLAARMKAIWKARKAAQGK